MTEFEGYKSPRHVSYSFLSNDWYPEGLKELFENYREEFRETVEEPSIEEDFWVVGDVNSRVDLHRLGELISDETTEIDVALADMELEAKDVNGTIRYEGYLPGEGAGRIRASFEVSDPELEEEVRKYVEDNFDSFLGLDTGYNPLRP